MTGNQANQAYSKELSRRFEELVRWAIDNWPERGRPLSEADFARVRQEMVQLGVPPETIVKEAPDPAAGGEQYVNINPSPWP